jgi:hypothetical protein
MNQLNDELQRLFGKIPKKPKETLANMQQMINALEYKRTTTSWTLNEEKAILKEIHAIQKQKLLLEEFQDYEKKVLNKKVRNTDESQTPDFYSPKHRYIRSSHIEACLTRFLSFTRDRWNLKRGENLSKLQLPRLTNWKKPSKSLDWLPNWDALWPI